MSKADINTLDSLINKMYVNEANLLHIINHPGRYINGTLREEVTKIAKTYARLQIEADRERVIKTARENVGLIWKWDVETAIRNLPIKLD